MTFKYDAEGITAMQFQLAPRGKYHWIITGIEERQSAAGDPQIIATCEIDDKLYAGAKVWHRVTFIPKGKPGAGIALHFLGCIGEPNEGQIDINPDNWRGRRFCADTIIENYVDKNGDPKQKNSFKSVYPPEDGKLSVEIAKPTNPDEEKVPF